MGLSARVCGAGPGVSAGNAGHCATPTRLLRRPKSCTQVVFHASAGASSVRSPRSERDPALARDRLRKGTARSSPVGEERIAAAVPDRGVSGPARTGEGRGHAAVPCAAPCARDWPTESRGCAHESPRGQMVTNRQ